MIETYSMKGKQACGFYEDGANPKISIKFDQVTFNQISNEAALRGISFAERARQLIAAGREAERERA